MVEYGNGISQGAGQVSGSHGGGGGGNVDLGAQLGSWVSSAQHTVSTMPAWELAIVVVAVLAGLLLFRRLI
jgi:hypothetical protein